MRPAQPNSRFHVPEPVARPGDVPDFSFLKGIAPGDLPRLPADVTAEGSRDHACGLVRVLDESGRAAGPWAPELSADRLVHALKLMILVRAYDDRMVRMQRQGKMSFYMKCTGEEAVSVGQAMALEPGDMIFPTYRLQGALLARGRKLVDMMNHCLSNAGDNCKGRQMPVFYSWKEGNFFSISGNLGTQFSQAVGWAMAAAHRETSDIAAAWVGEGTTAEADFHYAMTFAATYQAPVLLNIVNNQWAISSFHGIAGGERATFAERALGYGIPGVRVDGNDFLAVYAVTRWAAERARAGLGPTALELFTYRVDAHSTSDDPSRYRPREEAELWPLGDPLDRLRTHLVHLGAWDSDRHAAAEDAARAEVRDAFKQAEALGTLTTGQRPPVHTMFEDVFRDLPPNLRRQRQQMGI